VPKSIRRKAGIKAGDRFEFSVSGRVITILPKPSAADDEYTPAQRRAVDRAISEGLKDIEPGRLEGPFSSHKEIHRLAPKKEFLSAISIKFFDLACRQLLSLLHVSCEPGKTACYPAKRRSGKIPRNIPSKLGHRPPTFILWL